MVILHSTSTFYTFDPQGSVSARLNDQGAVVSTDLYDAYGSLRDGNPAGDPVGYCGQWGYYTDPYTGYILCTYRWYDPTTARWLTRDPIGYSGGMNLYGYVGGNPVGWEDADGKGGLRIGPYKNPCKNENKKGDCYDRLPWYNPESAYDEAKRIESQVFPNDDDMYGGGYRHCVAACLLNRRYGPVGHAVRKTWDFLFERDPRSEDDNRSDKRAEDIGEKLAGGDESCAIACIGSFPPKCRK